MANNKIKHRVKIIKKNGIRHELICYTNAMIHISFHIPKELFDENNIFEYNDTYLEETIEKNTEKKEVVFSTYMNLKDSYSIGDRPGVKYYWIKVHTDQIDKLPFYSGKALVLDENIKTDSKIDKKHKRKSKNKINIKSNEPESIFNTPYLKPEPIKSNLCKHPSVRRTGHNQKVSPTKVYFGGKFS